MNETPPGWYPAPDASDLMRYWDGEMWTDRARPVTGSRGGASMGFTGRPSLHVQTSEVVQEALEEDERVEAGFNGLAPRPMMMVATTARLLIFDPEGALRKYEVREYSYDDVEAIGTSPWTGLNITVGGTKFKLSTLDTSAMSDFIEYVRQRLPRSGQIVVSDLPPPGREQVADVALQEASGEAADGGDLVQQLAKLGELHTQGLLTDAEFSAAKAKLLES